MRRKADKKEKKKFLAGVFHIWPLQNVIKKQKQTKKPFLFIYVM